LFYGVSYAGPCRADADEMLVKAQLASRAATDMHEWGFFIPSL
jgi:hypothetical protein